MNSNWQKTARIVGALFIIAIVASILGGMLIDSIIGEPDYLTDTVSNETTVIIGVVLELINGIAVIGIAVGMFPIFRKQNESLALGYVAFRIIEAVIIVAAFIAPLTLIALSKEYSTVGPSEAVQFPAIGGTLISVREKLVGQILGIFFSIAALIFYYLLYQLDLVPRFITIWGFIAVVAVFTWNFLEFIGFSISVGIVFGLPIILNELFLGIWLIIKGFNLSKIESMTNSNIQLQP